MSKLTKNQKSVAGKIEAGKAYTVDEAASLVKEITTTKFDALWILTYVPVSIRAKRKWCVA